MAGLNGPYDNHMDIQLAQQLEFDPSWKEFVCDLIIEGVSAAAMAVAPEMVPEDVLADVDMEAVCEKFQ